MDLSESKVLELDEVALRILRTADLIEERGHCKCRLENAAGNVCLVGGLNLVFFGKAQNYDWSPLKQAAYNRISSVVGPDAVDWNNAPERTAEEVISTLRRIAFETNGMKP